MFLRELAALVTFKVDKSGAKEADRTFDRMTDRAGKAVSMIQGMFAAIAGAAVLGSLRAAADQSTTAMNQVTATLKGNADQAAAAMERITQSGLQTGIAVTETSKAFMTFVPSMQKAGFTANDAIGMIEGLQKGILATGATAAKAGDVMVQLGQAVNSNNFAGDELKAFMESASPTLLDSFAAALGQTTDKIKEMGAAGKLTNKVVLPALIAAARGGAREFDNMTVTMELASNRISVAWVALVGDLDKVFRASERVVSGLSWIKNSMEWVRAGIPQLRRFSEEIGGLDRIVKVLSITLGVMFLPVIIKVAIAIVVALAPVLLTFAALLIAVILVGEAIAWFSGQPNLISDYFGTFDQAKEIVNRAAEDIKYSFSQLWEVIKGMWAGVAEFFASIWATLKADAATFTGEIDRFVNFFTSIPDRIRAAWAGLGSYFTDMWGGIIRSFEGAQRAIEPITNAVGRARRFLGLGGEEPPAAPAGPGAPATAPAAPPGVRTGSLATDPYAQLASLNTLATSRGTGGGGGVSSLTVNIENSIPITTTGGSPAEISQGARDGVRRGNEDARTGAFEQLARALGTAAPRSEPASA